MVSLHAATSAAGRAASVKTRTGDPWTPAPDYGRALPAFTVNLLVRDVPRAIEFLLATARPAGRVRGMRVLAATVHYSDGDFAAINVGGVELMLHADHTYDKHPWHAPLVRGDRRGLGAELRVFGVDPDAVERRAREYGSSVVQPATTKAHGWREMMVEDPDGYLWAVGVRA